MMLFFSGLMAGIIVYGFGVKVFNEFYIWKMKREFQDALRGLPTRAVSDGKSLVTDTGNKKEWS
jgi:hypothetical protein